MSQPSKIITAASLCIFLSACGGGGGSDSTTATPANAGGTTVGQEAASNTNTGASTNPTGNNTGSTGTPGGTTGTSGGTTGTTPPTSGTPTSPTGNSGSPTATPPASSFAASVTQAPPDRATVSGTVRILVSGSGIQNVELLPETGYEPLIVRGVVTGDNIGAYVDLDTTVIPDGQVTFRVAAFNTPPGQNGSEITAMQARTWTVQNGAAPAFSAQLVSAPNESAENHEPRYFEVSGTNLGNVELVSANDESIVYGRFTISDDKTRATLAWTYRTPSDDKVYTTYQLRILAWDVPAGESGNKIEVMAPRTFSGIFNSGCRTCGGTAP